MILYEYKWFSFTGSQYVFDVIDCQVCFDVASKVKIDM